MRTLPLYPGDLRLAVEREEPRDLDPKCTRCPLSEGVRSPCMGAEASKNFAPGGVLVVGEFPSVRDDATGRPFRAATGDYVRKQIARHYAGPVVFDHAIRCAPSMKALAKKSLIEKARSACRGYLAGTLSEAKPSLILAFGTHGQHGVLGRAIPHTSLGGGAYAYTSEGVPVVFLPSPGLAMRNRFLRANFEAALKRALTEPFPAPEHLQGRAILVRNADETRIALRAVRRARWAAFDIESWGLLFTPDYQITAIAIATPGSVDAWQWTRGALQCPEVRALLTDWLTDASALKIGANIKFDALGCYSFFGQMIEGVHGDIRLWRKLLEPEADARLETMAEIVGQGGHKHEAQAEMAAQHARVTKRLAWERRRALAEQAGRKFSAEEPPTLREMGIPEGIEKIVRDPDVKKGAWVYGMLPGRVLYTYNSRDAVTTAAAGVVLEQQISQTSQKIIWDHVVKDASVALTWIEKWGAPVDLQALDYFEHSMRTQRDDAKRVLDAYAPINWGSSKQVGEFFFGKLGITPPKINEETGLPSVDKEVLTILKPLHPAADALINYRRADKLLGTYAVGMRKHIRPDGRIHTSYLLDGATTGRAASKDPNLQNIPRADTVEGKMARNIFTARPGWRLVQLDYSQLELRIAALLSGDPVMREVFVSGVDYHQRTAEIIAPFAWKIQAHQVEKKHRSAAKAFNFGLIYGKSDSTLAEDLGISVRDAAGIRAAILGTFVDLDHAMKDWLREARATGESWTMYGGVRTRRRPLWRIAEPEDGVRRNAENAAINTPIQGTAAEFATGSLWPIVSWILDEGIPARVIGTVHDSIALEVEPSAVSAVVDFCRRAMLSHDAGDVPIVVDADEGERWGELSPYGVAA